MNIESKENEIRILQEDFPDSKFNIMMKFILLGHDDVLVMECINYESTFIDKQDMDELIKKLTEMRERME